MLILVGIFVLETKVAKHVKDMLHLVVFWHICVKILGLCSFSMLAL